jgi:hypothetical protein
MVLSARLFVAQGHDWIDFGSALSWEIRREGCDYAKQEARSGKRQRIRGADIEQHAAEQAA